MHTVYRRAWIALLIASLLGACATIAPEPSAPLIPGLANTLAAQTLSALDIQDERFSTPEPPQVDPDQIISSEYLSTDSLDTQPATLAPEDLNNPSTDIAASPTPGCTNIAQFVRDITIPDNSSVNGGSRFVKTWEFKNAGTCTWNGEYSIIFMWGAAMDAPGQVPIGKTVAPGENIQISVPLIAPDEPQSYQGNWLFQDHTGRRFGIGYKGRQFFWVAINVDGGYGSSLSCSGGG